MRRALTWGIAVLGIAAAGWAGAWSWGRGEVAAALDREIAALERRGMAVSYEGREIGGFPFGYAARLDEVVLRDAGSGMVARLPHLEGAADVTDPGRLTTTLPPAFRVALPVPEARRAAEPRLPETLDIEIESEGLRVIAEAGGAGGHAVVADRLLAVHADPEGWLSFALEMTGLAIRARPRPRGAPGAPVTTVRLGGLDGLVTLLEADGPRMTLDVQGSGLDLTGRNGFASPAALGSALAGRAEGESRLALTGGPVRARLAVADDPGAPDGAIALGAQVLSAVVTLGADGLALRVGADRASGEIAPARAGSPVAGAVGASMIEALYEAPLGPSRQMRPLALGLSVLGLAPEEAVWERLDPDGVLPREPGNLALELRGTGRIPPPDADARPGRAMPFQLASLRIEEAALDALGAGARATGALAFDGGGQTPEDAIAGAPAIGALTFDEGGQTPEGTIAVTLEGAIPLLQKLGEAGLLSPETRQLGAVLLATYTEMGETRQEQRAEVKIGPDGIRVNGYRVR